MEFLKWLFWVFRDLAFMTISFLIIYWGYMAYIANDTMSMVTEQAHAGNMITYGLWQFNPLLGTTIHLVTLIGLCILTSFFVLYYGVFLGFFTTLWVTMTRFLTITWRKREDFTYHTDPIDGNDIFFAQWGVDGVRDRSRVLP